MGEPLSLPLGMVAVAVPKALLLLTLGEYTRGIRRGRWWRHRQAMPAREPASVPGCPRIADPDETHRRSGAVVHREVVGSGAAEASEMSVTTKLIYHSLDRCDLCHGPLTPEERTGGICPACRWPPDGKPPRVAKGSPAPKRSGLKAAVKVPHRRHAGKSGGSQ
jgi:hypothetical protein